MLTVIIRRNAEPTVIQMTEEAIMRELNSINGSEMLLEDTWTAGLRKVRTPFVCLVESDCVLSANFLSSNVGLMDKSGEKGGGYMKLALLGSCLGVNNFVNRIYNYRIVDNRLTVERDKLSSSPYQVEVAFVPGAIMRYSSIKDSVDFLPWDIKNLVEMSSEICLHLWNTGRRIQVNPNTTYVSSETYLETPPTTSPEVPYKAAQIFQGEGI